MQKPFAGSSIKVRILLRLCLLFDHVFQIQMGFTALANSRGKLEERLARWLLMAQDRVSGPDVVLTHDFLALMLGVRGADVSVALNRFEEQALVAVERGSIKILDREGLEEQANGFYGLPEAKFERVFGRGYNRAFWLIRQQFRAVNKGHASRLCEIFKHLSGISTHGTASGARNGDAVLPSDLVHYCLIRRACFAAHDRDMAAAIKAPWTEVPLPFKWRQYSRPVSH